ncbi:hypothetical protein F5B21DRAFT_502365 [Xylaria acuta]|nr:hypothetical protein F5B21DRAFT_502365 [Xylaria acuta]
MGPVTEAILLTLASDVDFDVIIESAKILARQPGCLAVRTSRLLDEPDTNTKAHHFIDWDSVDSHMAFARDKDVYQSFRDLVGTVMAGYDPPYHVALEPDLPDVVDRAAVVGKAWFPGDTSKKREEVVSKVLGGIC